MFELVKAVRDDELVGAATCSVLAECWSDDDIAAALRVVDAKNELDAIRWAHAEHLAWLERGLDQREGNDDDWQLVAYNEFVEDPRRIK